MEYLGFDPSTSSLLRTRASNCANTPEIRRRHFARAAAACRNLFFQSTRTVPALWGCIRIEKKCSFRGNEKIICSRRGSNSRPWDYETHALPAAPQELIMVRQEAWTSVLKFIWLQK